MKRLMVCTIALGVTSSGGKAVAVGPGGKVCLFAAESATHLIADVNGYFPG